MFQMKDRQQRGQQQAYTGAGVINVILLLDPSTKNQQLSPRTSVSTDKHPVTIGKLRRKAAFTRLPCATDEV
jgi:hypothetical protein